MPAKIEITDGTKAVLKRYGIDLDLTPTVVEARRAREALHNVDGDASELGGAMMELSEEIRQATEGDDTCDLCGGPATAMHPGMTGEFPVCDDHAPSRAQAPY